MRQYGGKLTEIRQLEGHVDSLKLELEGERHRVERAEAALRRISDTADGALPNDGSRQVERLRVHRFGPVVIAAKRTFPLERISG